MNGLRDSTGIMTDRFSAILAVLLCLVAASCKVEVASTSSDSTGAARAGTIRIDGSSTVAPISMPIAEAFGDQYPDVTPIVNISGTGGGFEKFSRGEIDVTNASRPIKPGEAEACRTNGIEFVEVKVAMDGLTVVVNQENDWVKSLSIPQLAEIWKKESPVRKWSDLDPGWPDAEIKLFAPDSKSGTYDYFKEETVGVNNPMRTDYQPNTDDNVLVTGVAGDRHALGFFGYAYYVASQDKLKAVPIAPEEGLEPVPPSQENIENGKYTPLSRPLFIYVHVDGLKRREIADFARFHLSDEGQRLIEEKQFIKLNAKELEASRQTLEAAIKSAQAEE